MLLLVGCGNTDNKNVKADTQQTETQSTSETETLEVNTEEETTENESEITTEVNTEVESETPTNTHEHSYIEKITQEATCTEKGEKTFYCECNNTYTEPIEKIEHSYGKYVYNNDATQSADGTKSRTCSVCGKVDTKTAEGTKLPFDPYSLRAITSLDEIASVGTLTNADDSTYDQVRENIEAGKYEKIRYIASNGDQFCMWNVRLTDERHKEEMHGIISYYWFMAPIEDEFSDGYKYSNLSGTNATAADKRMVVVGRNISCSINESMINNNTNLPPQYQTINSTECPVNLYEIVETDTMISVWVESTNCGQEGIGTCGTFDCKKTCLRYKTLETFRNLPRQKGWMNCYGGENGRINWNGKLLVNFYYLKG